MTRDEILNMPAGQETDLKIAELLGITTEEWNEMFFCLGRNKTRFSSDESCALWAAKKTVKKVRLGSFIMEYFTDRSVYRATLGLGWVYAKELPLAICRAIMLALVD